VSALLFALALLQPLRIDHGRFTVVCFPTHEVLARSVLGWAAANDTFPGLPRPKARVVIAIAPDHDRFREWIGPSVPEWGAAVAFPSSGRIVLHGSGGASDVGDPREVLRHELAHLALYEYLGGIAPDWFEEGYASYAAHEWSREDALATNVALALRGAPTLAELNDDLHGGSSRARDAYAFSFRAVADLAERNPARGLAPLLESWRRTRSLEHAMRLSYGITTTTFEREWRSRTRRRYGLLALVENVAFAGGVLALLLLPAYVGRRRRQRERLRDMVRADEARERALRDSLLEELLRARVDQPPGSAGETEDTGRAPPV
jgi:hypothetical protein